MKVAFRADGTANTGGGHITRCLTLAGIFSEKGISCIFISAEINDTLVRLIKKQGVHLEILPPARNQKLSEGMQKIASTQVPNILDQIYDAEKTNSILAKYNINVVIVDHYNLDATWHSIVKKPGLALVIVDDLGDRELLCDLLINPNDTADIHNAYHSLSPHSAKLLGREYTVFRKQIINCHDERLASSEAKIENGSIIVFLGGTDQDNITKKIIKTMISLGFSHKVAVIIGATNTRKNDILRYCERLNIFATANYENIYSLLTHAQMAIVASGMTAVEMQFIGIKTILIPLSDIQNTVAVSYQRAGRAVVASRDDINNSIKFKEILTAVMAIPAKSNLLSDSHSNAADNILLSIKQVLKNNGPS